MASSKKWANTISSIASCIYFLVIILQIPLFRVPCRGGICKTPLEVTASQLIATKVFPTVAVKPLLYPGAFANAFFKNKDVPNYYNFLRSHYKFTNSNPSPVNSDDLQRLEVLAGSYLSVVGAIIGLIKPGRMSLFGTLLIIWGLVRELIMRKSTYLYAGNKVVYIYPAMSIALVSAFLSVRRDVRKLFRSCKGQAVMKPKLV
ncbi:hypothetical protein UlMin_017310 [Ulmus minor]